MSDTRIKVSTKIKASPGRVFDILATPQKHPQTDASGMVLSDANTSPITKVGQVFRMNMKGADGSARYQTDNHVTAYKPSRVIAWRTAPADGEPLGWEWRYELALTKKGKTEVTLTYDWTGTSAENLRKYDVPTFSAEDLEASLAHLKASLTDD
ncbi:MAG: polyketide cyclase [Marmoricola sp.]|jgi:uncharacterized protein YndB with AHSA1/START domain|nr:polyketide cyclase [Marmoricola sp.]